MVKGDNSAYHRIAERNGFSGSNHFTLPIKFSSNRRPNGKIGLRKSIVKIFTIMGKLL
ncbi:MAG: hypothetical protein LBK92_00530 [Endomicrobium sp.]|jgi:hypothetical protein|nr:hypothetical protein [Endomicrobium sp.]